MLYLVSVPLVLIALFYVAIFFAGPNIQTWHCKRPK